MRTTLIVWIVSLVGLSVASFPSGLQQYVTADRQTVGFVGCTFSQNLCSFDEECLDDGLFGTCVRAFGDVSSEIHQHRLTSAQRSQMEFILSRLIESGYAWADDYTQCVITGVLLTYRTGTEHNLHLCDVDQQRDATRSRLALDDLERGGYDDVDYTVPLNDYESTIDEVQTPYGVVPIQEAEAEEETWDDVDVERRGNPNNGEFDEFLNGLSNEDIVDLEKYVAKDLQSAGEMQKFGDEAEDSHQFGNSDPSNYNWYGEAPAAAAIVDKKDDMQPAYNKPQRMITQVNVNYDPGLDSARSETMSNEEMELQQQKQQQEQQQQEEKPQVADNKPSAKVAEKPQMAASVPSTGAKFAAGKNVFAGNNVIQPRLQSGTGKEYNAGSSFGFAPESKPLGTRMGQKYVLTMYVLCGLVGVVTLGAIILYVVRRRSRLHDKISNWVSTGPQPPSEEYQDLCRQHMQTKISEKVEPVHPASRVETVSAIEEKAVARTGSTGSSTSSWTEEPVASNLDISTGHIVLAYMEDHLKNKHRLQQEWDTLSAYDPEPCSIVAAIEPTNMRKNRYTDILPYEHSRVKLNPSSNVSNSDFINASSIMDHDPRNPAYIATQGPLPHTVADFWQMIWEQGSVVIVNLTRITENGSTVCHRYWPEEGSDLYHIYEVHLVSEHVWCEDYVIRSFYLKNLQTSETRTVTQFHFVAWPNNEAPSSAKTLLDFRRKVNKSFRSRSSPIIVHCSDGAGRSGTYCLIDMVLNRLSKGAKEIDIAATLEHIRDQRVNMVRTKEQFEFALSAVAQEVQAILHAPP